MPLTPAQLVTLKTNIVANATPIPAAQPWSGTFAGTAINALPNNDDANTAIAGWYNMLTVAFQVYRNNIPIQEIEDKITYSALTPTDTADASLAWQNRAMSCQGKQFNLHLLTQGKDVVDATKVNWRAGMQDALTNVPSGVSGATVSAGWVPVRDSLYALATNAEQLYATGTGSTASPATRAVYGNISTQDVSSARNLP